ncbi:MAG: TIGR02147 family protein [Chitinispirillaceae bacterium]|nr:TIGR02147 family protein [Chitinispirillaceae bacterium]
MKPVLSYIDYRKYLRDFYEEKKRTTRFFSTRYFAQKAGLASASFLREVINGKKNLGKQSVDKFIQALELTGKEARFFKHLVFFNQAAGADEKQDHYAVLVSLMNTVREFQLTALQLQVYNYWYVPVIRELACIIDFRDDFELLAKMVLPQITTAEAKSAVKLLVRLKMLKKLKDGRYEQSSPAVKAKSEFNSMAVMNFTRGMAEMAIKALVSLPRNQRDFSTITCGMSRSCYDLIIAEMTAFRERVLAIINNDARTRNDRVYQFNFQVFPVSREQGEEDS